MYKYGKLMLLEKIITINNPSLSNIGGTRSRVRSLLLSFSNTIQGLKTNTNNYFTLRSFPLAPRPACLPKYALRSGRQIIPVINPAPARPPTNITVALQAR